MTLVFRSYPQPSACVALAKASLSDARYYKQRAQIERDMAENNWSDRSFLLKMAKTNEDNARLLRQTAKRYLQDHEEVIGTFYAMGIRKQPLKETLRGKDFQKWTEYQSAFGRTFDGLGDVWK